VRRSIPATILDHVVPGMPAYSEELFGPVASVLRAKDEADALRIANDTAFGLGASVWTRDLARGEALARAVRAGACFVNTMVRSDVRLPFGRHQDLRLRSRAGRAWHPRVHGPADRVRRRRYERGGRDASRRIRREQKNGVRVLFRGRMRGARRLMRREKAR
jgi:hypothetical protein